MSAPRPLGRHDLTRVASRLGVPTEVIEKDYILSYLLAGIAAVPGLSGLCFKGGTALKKMYFGDYRFSEDLDFSAVGVPSGVELDGLIGESRQAVLDRLATRGRFQIVIDRPPERGPYPTGQDVFRALVAFPWQRTPLVRLKIEVTHDEPVLLTAAERTMQHGYEEIGESIDDVHLATYALEEIVAEKLRAILQSRQRMHVRGWSRPRSRDYYDLWRILTERATEVHPALIRHILPEKLANRGVVYSTVDDFFSPPLQVEVRRHWQSNLGIFVPALPTADEVLATLPSLVGGLLEAVT